MLFRSQVAEQVWRAETQSQLESRGQRKEPGRGTSKWVFVTSQSRRPPPSVPEALSQSWLGLLATGCRDHGTPDTPGSEKSLPISGEANT